ncbi:MAG: hypothetical protein LBS60_09300 [Deltaproteobacteria bacterium]|nr:hypothetical protein [Deltaproteobacteria bacterium]
MDFGFKTFREREEKVRTIRLEAPIAPPVKERRAYILELSALTGLTQKTIGRILASLSPNARQALSLNPDLFILEASRLINEKKGSVMVLGAYFNQNSSLIAAKLFALGEELDRWRNLAPKLNKSKAIPSGDPQGPFYGPDPQGLTLKTPLGDYQLDWVFTAPEDGSKLLFFVAETKGTLTSLKLRSYATELAAQKSFDPFFTEPQDLFAGGGGRLSHPRADRRSSGL